MPRIEIVYRYDPDVRWERPRTTAQARRLLEDGNARFASFHRPGQMGDVRQVISLDPRALGISGVEGKPPKQTPFAAVVGCADARVPVDLIFEQAVNDLFVVRIAGNVLGDACLGSIEYAVSQLDSVCLVLVLGHSSCGAVTAAVDAYLEPARYPSVAGSQGLRSIVDRLFVSVRGAELSLRAAVGASVGERPGYRAALVETSVVVNAALTALTLRHELDQPVAFGVYDLLSRRVRVPRADHEDELGLLDPPTDLRELRELGVAIAASTFVQSILDDGP